ncbi:unnamed protein product [Parnassius apollo]|uniref:(apollo) hypothetical protein n=1 Tax=Parnassius apollo TaxID=110799 RepID=A0A8S3Y0Y7_PARAO|nr:unnamed protein product [Parnassius apollo]
MPRRLSTEDLRRILEESDYELSNGDTDLNGGDSDVQDEPDSDISDQKQSIFADDDIDDPDFEPEDGFVWNYDICIGRDPEIADLDKPGSVVVQLCDCLIEAGRIIVCDNYYNTVGLAKYLLQHKTDLCGTLRVNRKELPWAIRSKKNRT